MQIRKCLETRIIRQTEEIICEREILSKVYRVHPTKIQNKFVFEAFSEGFLLGGEIERSSIRFKIIWDLLTKDQKPFLGFYFSHNFSEIALLEQFPLISPFEEEVVIKFGFPDLICRCKLSNLCEMTVLANNSVFELFQKNIFVFKVKDHKKITYYLCPGYLGKATKLLLLGTHFSGNIEDLSELISVFQASKINVHFGNHKPQIIQKKPIVKLHFCSLKMDKNFVALSGQAHFLYPKSSKSRIFLRDLETQSQIINALSQQEIFIESSSASALNNSAIAVLQNSQKLSKSISDIYGIPIEIFISQEVKNVVRIKPLNFICEYLHNDIVIHTNLSRSEFSLLVEAISSEAYFNNKFLVLDSCLILPNLESIENLSLFLSYYGAEPDYQNCKFYIKQPNNLLLYSFAKFCSSTKGFQLIGFEKVMSKLKTIQAFTKQNFFKLYGYLRDYQNLGVSWLYHLYKHELGGLLADEMGLGKTVQTLVLIDYLKKSGQLENALVICPTSVVRNWEREALRFTPDLDLIVYHGPKRKENLNRINLASLVITTYPVLRYDSIFFQDINFSLIVIDEAQLIKNVDSLTTKTVKVLKSKVRLALTGTPVENRPLDLWSIFDFISERSLGSKRFFLTMVEKNASKDILDKLASSVKPFILRRLKCETLKSLPPKNETVEYCEMTETQREIYDIFAQTAKKLTTEYKSNKAIRYTHIFSAIMKLRQICNHPASLPEYAGALELTSGKMIRLLEILDELIANGRKVVIFCQFIQMIKLISDSLSAQGVQHYILTGQTKNRQEIVELFNSNKEPSAFVMSLKAGGLGINLTGASDVVLYDPWWNPQVENQAIDRLHRIGQEKIVFVYRLITVDSIESRMEQIKSEKRDVFDRILKNNFSKIDVSLLTNLLL